MPAARRDAVGVLLRLTRALTADTSLEDSLHAVTDAALELVPGDHASIRLLDGVKASLLSGARSGKGAGEKPLVFRRNEGILGWVVEHKEPAFVGDARSDLRFVSHEGQGFKIQSLIAEPLWAGGDVIGVLSVSSPKREAFTEDDQLLVRLLANCSISPVEKARLRRLAVVDDLTLAFNHRYLSPRLREEIERVKRTGAPLSLLLMDLDHFKSVNDAHGHAVGDVVLRTFADRVRSSVRRLDVLVRRGGEEFVLLMPGTSSPEAKVIAERIQEALAAASVVTDAGPVRQTVSTGLATWDGSESAEALERRADLAMYEAKRRGRNRVVVATAESAATKGRRK